jgi:hypothetical protein
MANDPGGTAGRVQLPDGRWLQLRPMWLSDQLAIQQLQAEDDDGNVSDLQRMQRYADILGPAVKAKSDGWASLLDMTEERFLWVFQQWSKLTDEDALPEV